MKSLKDIYSLEDWRLGKYFDNEPLLEYAVDLSDRFWPQCDGYDEEGNPDLFSSDVPRMFVGYYLKGEIDTSMAQTYLNDKEVQKTLKAFELDHEKFWYLCLMVKDVVRGFTEDARPEAFTPRQELTMLVYELWNMEPEFHDFEDYKGWKACKNAGELTLKIKEKGKKYSSTFTIKSKKTLTYLAMAVHQFLERNPIPAPPQSSDLDSVTGFEEIFRNEKVTEKEIWRVALFHKYIDRFLDKHLESKTVKRKLARKVTKSAFTYDSVDIYKKHLISRMIYILGISKNDSYNDLENYKILKNNLKRIYKDPTPINQNSRYSTC